MLVLFLRVISARLEVWALGWDLSIFCHLSLGFDIRALGFYRIPVKQSVGPYFQSTGPKCSLPGKPATWTPEVCQNSLLGYYFTYFRASGNFNEFGAAAVHSGIIR